MSTSPNIVLIGFMGTGKTTAGKQVAHQLNMRFIDMDDCIVERAGKPIPEIFAEDGEPAFRQLERQVVIDLSRQGNQVIATGGGVVLNPENTRDLALSGLLINLKASPEIILQRVQSDTGRPLLNDGDKGTKIRTLLASRQHLYDAIPHMIDTDPLDSDAVAARIITLYDQFNR